MKNYRYIIMAAVLASAASCNEGFDTGLGTGSGTPIEFRAGIETRAFLTSDDLNAANTEITVWGYEDTDAFIQGKAASYDAAAGWILDKTYNWANNRSYTFFSYLTKDKDGHSISGLSVSGRALTVPSRTFDFASTDNDIDFCYSDVVYRPSDKADHSAVNFNMKHFYTAIAFSAHNYTTDEITIKEVSLVGLKNTKSATINFADTGAVVTYSNAACTWTGSTRKLNSSDIIIAEDGEYANIVGTASDTPQYYMFWPQTSAELDVTGLTDSNTQPTAGAYLKVVYQCGDSGTDLIKYVRFPQEIDGTESNGWPAGTKRMMQLAFRDNMFTLLLKAAPWDYITPVVDYGKEVDKSTIEALHFDETTCTVDEDNHLVYFKGSNPITGTFKITNPTNTTWVISKEGDYDAFELDNAATSKYNDGKDCNYGSIDGNDCSFTLFPNVSNTGKTYSIQLTFSIRYSNGESVCVDDEIQPVKWTFILTD